MPKKTFTASVLTAADMNTYLMNQAVITCTSGTRPSGPVEGMTIYETDTDCYATYTGTAWEYQLGGVWSSWTPTLTAITLGNGTVTARYSITGKTISGQVVFTAGSTTTYSGGNLGFSVPVTPKSVTNLNLAPCGSAYVDNGTGATRRIAATSIESAARFTLFYEGGTVTSSAPLTLGTGSRIGIGFSYEAA